MNSVKRADAADGSIEDSPLVFSAVASRFIDYIECHALEMTVPAIYLQVTRVKYCTLIAHIGLTMGTYSELLSKVFENVILIQLKDTCQMK